MTTPVRCSVTVEAPVETAFRVFTEELGTWWPLRRHSVDPGLAEEAVLEPRLGGAVYERWADGRRNWGEVLVWEPPHRLVFSWHPGREAAEATEVEVRFAVDGRRTLVELEHRGWEVLQERAADVRAGYEEGWPGVLELYAETAGEGARAGT